MWLWVVYVVRGVTPRLSSRLYVGCVRVRDGETVKKALARRKDEHAGLVLTRRGLKKRALWLKICTGLVIDQVGESLN